MHAQNQISSCKECRGGACNAPTVHCLVNTVHAVVTRRCVSVPGNSVHPATQHRLLPDPGLRAERAHRHPVVGLVV